MYFDECGNINSQELAWNEFVIENVQSNGNLKTIQITKQNMLVE